MPLLLKKVIGTITVSKQEQSTTLSGFAVHPSYQGKGYGKDILCNIVHTLITEGVSTIELDVETKKYPRFKNYIHNVVLKLKRGMTIII